MVIPETNAISYYVGRSVRYNQATVREAVISQAHSKIISPPNLNSDCKIPAAQYLRPSAKKICVHLREMLTPVGKH